MAEHTGTYVTGKFDQAIQDQPSVAHNGGRVRAVVDRIASTDAAQNDTILLARLPSNAVILPTSKVYHSALGASVTADVGVRATKTGDFTIDPNGLSDGADVSSAGSFDLLDSITANAGKRLWEYTDASADPGREIDIYLSLVDANPAAGTVAWEIHYTID